MYERTRRNALDREALDRGGAVAEEAFVDEGDDEELFLPLRLLYAVRPRDGRDRYRERELAERVRRRKEHWEQRRGHSPRRMRGLSRDDIVGTAIAVADAEGTDAVSIRRIARDLRVGAMSLYWYIESKEELHQLMLERVQAEIEAPEPSGDWRADLSGYARNMRTALLRHPWAIDFLGVGPPSGPNDARNAERLIAALDSSAADPMTVMWALMTIGTYVMGAVLREIQELRWQRGADEVTADMSEAEISGFLTEFDRRIRESGRYPHLTKILEANIDPDAPESRHERFEFGLGCLLDGIAARISAARRGS